MTEEQLDKLRVEYGLDKPVPVQYVNWVEGGLTGDLGESISTTRTSANCLLERFPVTLLSGSLALVISTILGIFFGLIAAIRTGQVDRLRRDLPVLHRSDHTRLHAGYRC